MAKDSVLFKTASSTSPGDDETTLAELRGDCARMASHWPAPHAEASASVPPSLIHGVSVPPGSLRLIAGMSEYGD